MMKKNLLILFLAVSSIFFLFKQDYIFSETLGEDLNLYLGTNQTIEISNPTRIAIGNPSIIDVGQVTKKELTIVPKAVGTTTLVFWDNFGEQSYIVHVFSVDMKKIKLRIDNVLAKLALSGLTTKAEDEESKVFLIGKLDNAQDRDRVNLALGDLKKYTTDLTTITEDQAVVEIDVQVLELKKGATDTLGFTWPDSIQISDVVPATATSSWVKLLKLGDMTRSAAYTLKLDMLVKEGKARILSHPRLACLSGKEAKLLVGGEVPIISSSVIGGGTEGTTATPGAVQYKEYGIKLSIKPTAKPDNRIYVNLEVEVSEVGTAVTTSYALAYPFIKRAANTELYLNNGQTMAIGGLIKQKTEDELRKLPWLADIPVLGLFFRQKSHTQGGGSASREDSELFITLTPRVVSNMGDTKNKSEIKLKPSLTDINEASLDPVTKYSNIVQQRIMKKITYPGSAKEAGFQGTVKLSLKLSYKGELLDSKLKSSSGYKVLDDNALSVVKNISPDYPPFPPAITSHELWIDVPINYQLD